MGNFYTNVTLKLAGAADVIGYLRKTGRKAFVARPDATSAVVFDSATETQDDKILCKLTSDLSREFASPALAVLNHDDDILCYWLYQFGKELDRYDSNPGYFNGKGTPPTGGDAKLLIDAFASGADIGRVDDILRFPKSSASRSNVTTGRPRYAFAFEQHSDLVKALGLPECAVGAGYKYLEEDDFLEDLQDNNFEHT